MGRCSALSICLAVGIIQNAGATPPNSKVQAITQAEEGEIFSRAALGKTHTELIYKVMESKKKKKSNMWQ